MWAHPDVREVAGRRLDGATALLAALIAACLLVLLATEFVSVRDPGVEWGTFRTSSVSCEWGSCASIGTWTSDSGAVRIGSARVEAQLPAGQSARAAIMPTAWDEQSSGVVPVVTEYTETARLWVMATATLVTTGVAVALWRGWRLSGPRGGLGEGRVGGVRPSLGEDTTNSRMEN